MNSSWSATARRPRPVTDSARTSASRGGVFFCSLPPEQPATAGLVGAELRFARLYAGATYIMHGLRASRGAGRGPMKNRVQNGTNEHLVQPGG